MASKRQQKYSYWSACHPAVCTARTDLLIAGAVDSAPETGVGYIGREEKPIEPKSNSVSAVGDARNWRRAWPSLFASLIGEEEKCRFIVVPSIPYLSSSERAFHIESSHFDHLPLERMNYDAVSLDTLLETKAAIRTELESLEKKQCRWDIAEAIPGVLFDTGGFSVQSSREDRDFADIIRLWSDHEPPSHSAPYPAPIWQSQRHLRTLVAEIVQKVTDVETLSVTYRRLRAFLKSQYERVSRLVLTYLRWTAVPAFLHCVILIEEDWFLYHGIGRPPRMLGRVPGTGLSQVIGRTCFSPVLTL